MPWPTFDNQELALDVPTDVGQSGWDAVHQSLGQSTILLLEQSEILVGFRQDIDLNVESELAVIPADVYVCVTRVIIDSRSVGVLSGDFSCGTNLGFDNILKDEPVVIGASSPNPNCRTILTGQARVTVPGVGVNHASGEVINGKIGGAGIWPATGVSVLLMGLVVPVA